MSQPSTHRTTFGSRTFLDVRIGAFHSAEIVLYLRKADQAWFRREEHWPQVLELLSQSIVPRLFDEEIEVVHARETSTRLPPKLGPGGVPLPVGERIVAAQRKKKRRLTKKQQQEMEKEQNQDKKKEKSVYYVFGKTVQVAYRLEEPKAKRSAVLLMKNREFTALTKLSKVIHLWCFPYDPKNPDEVLMDPSFCVPECMPVASLFRSHEENGK